MSNYGGIEISKIDKSVGPGLSQRFTKSPISQRTALCLKKILVGLFTHGLSDFSIYSHEP